MWVREKMIIALLPWFKFSFPLFFCLKKGKYYIQQELNSLRIKPVSFPSPSSETHERRKSLPMNHTLFFSRANWLVISFSVTADVSDVSWLMCACHPTAAVYTTFFNIILTSVECNNVLHSLMLNGVHFTGGSLQSLSGELIMVSSHGCESMFTNAWCVQYIRRTRFLRLFNFIIYTNKLST